MTKKTFQEHIFKTLAMYMFLSFIMSNLIWYIFAVFNYDREDYIPDKMDLITTLISTLATVSIAFYFSLRTARKILPPLRSIATSARKIAEGELSSRASINTHSIKEMDLLVNDFNLMAEKLEQASRNMQTWNATIAHELRTPVTVLRANMIAIKDEIIELSVGTIDSLIRQTDNLSHIIEDLRVVSLAGTAQIKLYREHFQLEGVIRESFKQFEVQFGLAGKKIQTISQELLVYADRERIMQLINALLHNALKYSNAGKINIGCYKEKNIYTLFVEDEGPGIEPALRDRIFDPFYFIEHSEGGGGSSSGLGLSVVKAIANAHGGWVECTDSELGGIRFNVNLFM